MLVVNLFSPDESYDQLRSATTPRSTSDELSRINGVGDVTYLGQMDYSMRAWLDPEKLASRNLTAGDVANAVRDRTSRLPQARSASLPCRGLDFQYTMSTLGRLNDPEQFTPHRHQGG
jgi:multidrug efflux pump